ncbi:MAG: hypothetical protein ABIN97_17850 [Ginsengibacter sp.]
MKIINGLLFFVMSFIPGIEKAFSQRYQGFFDMHIPHAPDFVTITGKPTVYYELHLSNLASDSIVLQGLEVIDAFDSTVVFLIDKDDLKKRYARVEANAIDKECMLAPGIHV